MSELFTPAEQDFIDGYRDGRDPDAPEPSANRSACYRHSFDIGRREIEKRIMPADQARERAAEAERIDDVR